MKGGVLLLGETRVGGGEGGGEQTAVTLQCVSF